jgi:probable FeS assembly SUF system protein SufT
VTLRRDVDAITIPYGQTARLAAETSVTILQQLGGNYTAQTPRGELVRIDARDADALGIAAVVSSEESDATDDDRALEDRVWDVLRTCYDPEIPVNVVDLGLIYSCQVVPIEGGHSVDIAFTLTAPGCGMGDVLRRDMESKVAALPGVAEVVVRVVVEPQWHQGMMSDAAKLQLGLL